MNLTTDGLHPVATSAAGADMMYYHNSSAALASSVAGAAASEPPPPHAHDGGFLSQILGVDELQLMEMPMSDGERGTVCAGTVVGRRVDRSGTVVGRRMDRSGTVCVGAVLGRRVDRSGTDPVPSAPTSGRIERSGKVDGSSKYDCHGIVFRVGRLSRIWTDTSR